MKKQLLMVVTCFLVLVNSYAFADTLSDTDPVCGFAAGGVFQARGEIKPDDMCFVGEVSNKYFSNYQDTDRAYKWVCENAGKTQGCAAKKANINFGIKYVSSDTSWGQPSLVVKNLISGEEKSFPLAIGPYHYEVLLAQGGWEKGFVVIHSLLNYAYGAHHQYVLLYSGGEHNLKELALAQKFSYLVDDVCMNGKFGPVKARLVGGNLIVEEQDRMEYESSSYSHGFCTPVNVTAKWTDYVLWRVGPDGVTKVRAYRQDYDLTQN